MPRETSCFLLWQGPDGSSLSSFVPSDRAAWGAGLSAVAKDADSDRLVLHARPANELEIPCARWVGSLASAASLSGIVLKPSESLVFSGTDLKDCFYQFRAGAQRTLRNHLNCKLTLQEALEIFEMPCAEFQQPDGSILCGLSSLVMGDCSACEFAQCAHLGVLVQAGVVVDGELLVHAAPPPRGLLSVGLVIDDLIILERVLTADLPEMAS